MSAAAIERALGEEFPDWPSERTIANWIKTGKIRPVGDLWSLPNAEPGEAEHVLPVLAAIPTGMNRRWITRPEARMVARLGAVAPKMHPLTQLFLAQEYLGMESIKASTWYLDRFLAVYLSLQAWTADGLDLLTSAIADGRVEAPQAARNGFDLDLMGAIEKGIHG